MRCTCCLANQNVPPRRGLTSVYPLAMILSQLGDAVWIESSPAGLPQANLPKQAWTTLNYKLGQAAGSFSKPVFVAQYPNSGVDGSLTSTICKPLSK